MPARRNALRRVARRNLNWLLAALTLLGFAVGAVLDVSGWLNDTPITGNLVATLLGAPATVLLSGLIFDRIAATRRAQDWMDSRGHSIQYLVLPQLRAVTTALELSWPLDASQTFDSELQSVLDRYGELSRRTPGMTPGDPLDPPLRALTSSVAQSVTRISADETVGMIKSVLPTLDLVINQGEAPKLTASAFALRAATHSYIEVVESDGHSAFRFVIALRDLSAREWQWTDAGKSFRVQKENVVVTHYAGGIATFGFQYQQQLRAARAVQTAVSTLQQELQTLLT